MFDIPESLKQKLADAKSDNEACEILADGGMNLEAMERELSDQELEGVAGGWDSANKCPYCGENNGDNISYQFWASLFIDSGSKYRCRTCNNYFYIIQQGVRKYY